MGILALIKRNVTARCALVGWDATAPRRPLRLLTRELLHDRIVPLSRPLQLPRLYGSRREGTRPAMKSSPCVLHRVPSLLY